jgi:hypothetical protein
MFRLAVSDWGLRASFVLLVMAGEDFSEVIPQRFHTGKGAGKSTFAWESSVL